MLPREASSVQEPNNSVSRVLAVQVLGSGEVSDYEIGLWALSGSGCRVWGLVLMVWVWGLHHERTHVHPRKT